MSKLTGRARYRLYHYGVWVVKSALVLQVEEIQERAENFCNQVTVNTVSVWRDARVEDLPIVINTLAEEITNEQ